MRKLFLGTVCLVIVLGALRPALAAPAIPPSARSTYQHQHHHRHRHRRHRHPRHAS